MKQDEVLQVVQGDPHSAIDDDYYFDQVPDPLPVRGGKGQLLKHMVKPKIALNIPHGRFCVWLSLGRKDIAHKIVIFGIGRKVVVAGAMDPDQCDFLRIEALQLFAVTDRY